MRTSEYQKLLLKAAVSMTACDGSVDEAEINEVKLMLQNEIYFMGFENENLLDEYLEDIIKSGKKSINYFLDQLGESDLNTKQEFNLLEVLIRTIESDNKIEENELKFLQLVKSKLNISEEDIITQFPKQMKYLIDFNNYGSLREFSEEINIT